VYVCVLCLPCLGFRVVLMCCVFTFVFRVVLMCCVFTFVFVMCLCLCLCFRVVFSCCVFVLCFYLCFRFGVFLFCMLCTIPHTLTYSNKQSIHQYHYVRVKYFAYWIYTPGEWTGLDDLVKWVDIWQRAWCWSPMHWALTQNTPDIYFAANPMPL
jgi:hypothetical protein